MQEAKKGRPAKKKDASDTESECGEPAKKRGRPKKNKKVVSGSVGDDLIANLLANATVAEPEILPPNVPLVVVAAVEESKKPSEGEKRIARNEKARQKREEKKALQKAAKIQLAAEVKNQGGDGAEEEKLNLTKETLAEIDEVFDADAELKESPTSLSGCSDATPEVKVTKFEFDGKTYLKDDDNCMFDMESQDHIGNWNGTGIDYCDEEDE